MINIPFYQFLPRIFMIENIQSHTSKTVKLASARYFLMISIVSVLSNTGSLENASENLMYIYMKPNLIQLVICHFIHVKFTLLPSQYNVELRYQIPCIDHQTFYMPFLFRDKMLNYCTVNDMQKYEVKHVDMKN